MLEIEAGSSRTSPSCWMRAGSIVTLLEETGETLRQKRKDRCDCDGCQGIASKFSKTSLLGVKLSFHLPEHRYESDTSEWIRMQLLKRPESSKPLQCRGRVGQNESFHIKLTSLSSSLEDKYVSQSSRPAVTVMIPGLAPPPNWSLPPPRRGILVRFSRPRHDQLCTFRACKKVRIVTSVPVCLSRIIMLMFNQS